MTTPVLAQAVLALAVLARAVQRQSHPVNCSREVVIGALGSSFVLCDGQVVTFIKAPLAHSQTTARRISYCKNLCLPRVKKQRENTNVLTREKHRKN